MTRIVCVGITVLDRIWYLDDLPKEGGKYVAKDYTEVGGGPAAQPVSNSQLETVLGSSGGLLSMITSRLSLPRDNVTGALGYLLPAIVGKLTPGGSMPSSLPPEVASLAAAGQGLLAAPAVGAAQGATAGGIGNVMGALLGVLFTGVINGALPVIHISPFWQQAISGFVILVAVIVNARSERRAGKQILPPKGATAASSNNHRAQLQGSKS